MPRGEHEHREIGGRYRLVERVGEGGMGIVHEGYDVQLGRVVAIKEIRRRRAKSTRARARLRREAAAMAQLSHPNVVRVFDVVEDRGGIFVVMEFVDGETLDLHMTRADLGWRAVVQLFLGIGAGLAAIHARGLVHRDFKPANVLIAADGRPRVTDFGLAQFPGDSSSAAEGSESGERRDLLSPLTAPGTVAGTPRYMAPEQHVGAAVDAQADQYAYCLVLWEALCGQLPFRQQEAAKLAEAKQRGVGDGAPLRVPAPVAHVVVRGLAPKPERRWPSMAHLMTALARAQQRRTRAWWIAPPAIAGAAVLALLPRDDTLGCRDATEALSPAWGAGQREALAAALDVAKPRVSPATASQLLLAIDTWGDAWVEAYAAACRAAPGPGRDAPLACLRQHRARLGGTLDVLRSDDPTVLMRGLELMAALPRVDACHAPQHMDGAVAPNHRAVVLQRAVARAEAFGRAGQHDEARRAAAGVLADLSCTEFPKACTRLRLVHGRASAGTGAFDASTRAYEEAYATALREGDDATASRAALLLAFNASAYAPDLPAARRWLEHADALAERVDDPPADLRTGVATMTARLELQAGNLPAALVHAERGIELCAPARGGSRCGHPLGTLGWVLTYRGDYERAEGVLRQALSAVQAEVGTDHERTAKAYGALAVVLEQLGRDDEVLPLLERQLEISERVHGSAHPEALGAKVSVAKQLMDRDEATRAKALLGEAIGDAEGNDTVPDFVRASVYSVDAYVDAGMGRHRDARRGLLRSLEIAAGLLGADHPTNASDLTRLAATERELGRYDLAQDELRKAEALVSDRVFRAILYRDWTLLHLRRGDVQSADASLARAEAAWAERPWLDAAVAAQRAHLYGLLALARGEAAAARVHLHNARELLANGALVHPQTRLRYATALARAQIADGDPQVGLDTLDEVADLATEGRPLELLAEYNFVRGQALWPTHRQQARRHIAEAKAAIQRAEGGVHLRAEIGTWPRPEGTL